MKSGKKTGFVILLTVFFSCSQKDGLKYTVTKTPWPENLGSQRTVLEVKKPAEVVALNYTWRRHDLSPEKKKFLIISATSGDTVKNIYRGKVNNEKCELLFGPVHAPGKYYFYYLPYKVQNGWGFFHNNYDKPEDPPDKTWLKSVKLSDTLQAEVVEIQSRTDFDSFYPMEVIALKTEKETYLQKYNSDYLLFPEDRKFPIRMWDEIPCKWLQKVPGETFKGTAMKNEYYVFQIGVFASKKTLNSVKVEFSDLKNGEKVIPSGNLTCFNTEGTDPYGKHFNIDVNVKENRVQALWIGVDIPGDIQAGVYEGLVRIIPENSAPQRVPVEIKIGKSSIADRGDSELWRHSRLRWLNSTLGLNDEPVSPYTPIENTGHKHFKILGREIKLRESGLPEQFFSLDHPVFSKPVAFVIKTDKGREKLTTEGSELMLDASGKKILVFRSSGKDIKISYKISVEADGYLLYKLKLIPLKDLHVKDIRLEFSLRKEIGRYFMGMGLPGQLTPKSYSWKWKGPTDSFWIGNAQAGIFCELRGASYTGPLLNLYHPDPPESWYNKNKGGFTLRTNQDQVEAIVYTGKRALVKNEPLNFEFAMLLTPVKKLDPKSQFVNRYYHSGGLPRPKKKDLEKGIKIVNIHHANRYNPYINYPFIATKELKGLVDTLHQKGVKVKLYYTIRELTNHVAEIWALRSLGNEIYGSGPGGGFPWLREHLMYGYRAQWYQHFTDKASDASIVNAPETSRWYNYYIEGLAWLVKNMDIDGLYLDDVSYDRHILKRMRKAMDEVKPGCMFDLHSNTGFSKGPATQYMEFFPYVDKLWFGESFLYDEMSPANWLVEVSGIPYGLMGDMLQGGGNPWRGMIYGMTARYPWTTDGVKCDPGDIWRIWDEFGISGSKMIGYWDEHPVVKTTHPEVLATAYLKDDKMLVSLASWADHPVNVKLVIDWKKTGLDPEEMVFRAPWILNFQEEKQFTQNQSILVKPKKGWLIYIERKSDFVI